jgi:hypothetical protein
LSFRILCLFIILLFFYFFYFFINSSDFISIKHILISIFIIIYLAVFIFSLFLFLNHILIFQCLIFNIIQSLSRWRYILHSFSISIKLFLFFVMLILNCIDSDFFKLFNIVLLCFFIIFWDWELFFFLRLLLQAHFRVYIIKLEIRIRSTIHAHIVKARHHAHCVWSCLVYKGAWNLHFNKCIFVRTFVNAQL